MKTTPHLGLKYGEPTYDGGIELIAGRNLDKIEAELVRLCGLAEIEIPVTFKRGGYTFDAGQESGARDNLIAIELVINDLVAAVDDDIDELSLDTSLAAVDGGSSAVMSRNLLAIDRACQELSEQLEEETPDPDPEPDPDPDPDPGSETEVVPEAPVNVEPPTISGTPEIGETLTANNGTWTGTPEPTFTYQWVSNNEEVEDATSQTYQLSSSDTGAAGYVKVTATNSEGSASVSSEYVGPVSGFEPTDP